MKLTTLNISVHVKLSCRIVSHQGACLPQTGWTGST